MTDQTESNAEKKPEEQPQDASQRLRRIMAANPDDITPPRGTRLEHPTGTPEQTGGWYGESQGDLPPQTGSFAQTIPNESALPGEDPTIPPAQYVPGQTPLPRRVEEVDPDATRVTPAAYQTPPRGTQTRTPEPPYPTRPTESAYPAQPAYPQRPAAPPPRPPVQRPAPVYQPAPPPPPPPSRPTPVSRPKGKGKGSGGGCLLRGLVALLFLVALVVIGTGTFLIYQYFSIASTLPDVADLRQRASQFETTRILDRKGNLLYEILDPNAGRRTFVPLAKISPFLQAATIATEDKEFYNHPGFDPIAISRALWQNYTTGEVVSGASTITQQLARSLLLSPEERGERTVQRKSREIVLAAEITRRYTKDEILELYLNEIYYGNLSYGVEAAAETYFNTTADKLTLAQASFLAGLPQSPSVYDVFTNREAALARHKQVLELMYQVSQEKNCIEINNQVARVCVEKPAALQALQEVESYTFQPRQNTIRFPHWVNYIRAELERQFDAQTIYRSGFTVYTTLDPDMQQQAEQIVAQQVQLLADRNVTDGALVAVQPATGEILAMVGSADFNNEAISGQVNMSISPRQPGSSIKPLTYAAAFEKGWTPATLIWDVPTDFPPSGDVNDQRPPYQPVNYDGRFHGPVTVRTALANSYNIPAVKALQFVGIYDNPGTAGEDGFLAFARRMGITTLNRPDYGLSLTLGGGDVSLLDMTSAYGIFANSGKRMPPVSILRITDFKGKSIYEYQPPSPDLVLRPEHAYLISSILSDNEARSAAFGPNSVLNLPFAAAAKTGTTNDYRDNWTMGYTPDLAVGVWVGNADYTPMQNTTGLSGAAPIWSQFMQFAVPYLTDSQPSPFVRPPDIVDKVICSVSGSEPSEWCPNQRGEIFASNQLPLPREQDLWMKAQIDTWTGLLASSSCSEFTDEKFALNVTDPSAVKWIRQTEEGRAWADENGFSDPIFFAPARECRSDDPRAIIVFSGLAENQKVTSGPLDIYAVVMATDHFKQFRLEYGMGDDPASWKPLVEEIRSEYKQPESVYSWDLTGKKVPTGKITLRIYLESDEDTYAEKRIHLIFDVPTPTPTTEPTQLPTITPTPTPPLIPTPLPLDTDTPTPEPSATTAP